MEGAKGTREQDGDTPTRGRLEGGHRSGDKGVSATAGSFLKTSSKGQHRVVHFLGFITFGCG